MLSTRVHLLLVVVTVVVVMFATVAAAAEAAKIPDATRADYAIAQRKLAELQRDAMELNNQYRQASQAIQDKYKSVQVELTRAMAVAEKTCVAAGKELDTEAIACKDRVVAKAPAAPTPEVKSVK